MPIHVADQDTPDGQYDVDYETGVITAAATPGEGYFNLLDAEVKTLFMPTFPVGFEAAGTAGKADFQVNVYGSEWIHPSWKVFFEATKVSANNGKVLLWLLAFRQNTRET